MVIMVRFGDVAGVTLRMLKALGAMLERVTWMRLPLGSPISQPTHHDIFA
jgi:hypothetical protein